MELYGRDLAENLKYMVEILVIILKLVMDSLDFVLGVRELETKVFKIFLA